MDKQEYHTLIRRLKRQAARDKKRPIYSQKTQGEEKTTSKKKKEET